LLDDLMGRVAPCFARRETRLTCRDMVNGLLAELEDYSLVGLSLCPQWVPRELAAVSGITVRHHM